MARIRSIHPGIWTDEDFVEMSATARLFMLGLWNEADDYGVLEWRPTKLKMRLAPVDNIDAGAVMEEIEAAGFLVRIDRGGKTYAVIKNFRKWQRPKNPAKPLITVDEEIASIIKLDERGSPTPALPQPYPSNGEISPQMEEGGGRRDDGKGNGSKGGERASARGRPPRKHPLEFDWQPSAETVERCNALGLTAEEIAGQCVVFGTWHRSRGEERADWQEAFFLWCKREADKLGRKPGKPPIPRETVYIRQLDDAWEIYAEAWKVKRGRSPPTDRDGGWHFPADLLETTTSH